MPITRTAMIDDDGSGTTGTIINNAWKQELYGQIDTVVTPPWVDIFFGGTTFVAQGGAGGVWTVSAGNLQTLAYIVNGKSLTIAFSIVNAALSGSAGSLVIQPAGLQPAIRYFTNPFSYYVGSQAGVGMIEQAVGQSKLVLYPALGGALWPAAATMYLMGQITYPIA